MKVFRWIAAGLLALWSSGAPAQDWPTGPVTIIVPFAADSTPDIVARALAGSLERTFKKTFTVENKPGSSGNLGTGLVAKAAPDGLTLGVTVGAPMTVNTVLFPKLPYDPFKDIAPITVLSTQPSVLAVNTKAGIDSVEALIESFKKEPNRFNYGSIGTGTLSHLAMELVATRSDGRPVHIVFGGSHEAVAAMAQGEIQIVCLPASAIASQVKSGAAKMLAVTSVKRSPFFPELRTLKEVGIADAVADAWIGLVAPGKTNEAVVAKIHQAAKTALADPKLLDAFKTRFMEPVGNTPEEFKTFLRAELDRWLPVIKAGNIRLN